MTPEHHDSDVAVTITGRDVWDKLVKIELVVTGIPAVVADHEARLRKLETKMWLATGFVLASGGTGAVLAKYIGA